MKTSLFFHLVTSIEVKSCCYLKAWKDVVSEMHREKAFGSVVSDNCSASLKDKSFEVNIKSFSLCAWFKFQALYL